MKVRVKDGQKGFYSGLIREPGDIFYLSDKNSYSSRWMEVIKECSEKPKKPNQLMGIIKEYSEKPKKPSQLMGIIKEYSEKPKKKDKKRGSS